MTEALTSSTKLVRADGLEFRIEADGRITAAMPGGGRVNAGRHGLLILDAFASPVSVQEAVGILGAAGGQDWIDLTSTIRRLAEASVLVGPGPSRAATRGYGSANIHIRMLDDRTRTDAYIAAIDAVVESGDVVVDVGTGTGVLSVAAARAGAARVYTVEMNPRIADVAEQVFADNGFADRIILVRGSSMSVDLPERADVLVSEMLGNSIFEERMIEVYADTKARFLAPEARMIPMQVGVVAALHTVPPKRLHAAVAGPEHEARWRDWYGIGLGALSGLSPNPARPMVNRRPVDVANWPLLGGPVEVMRVDAPFRDLAAIGTASITASGSGVVHGVSLTFDALLAEGVSLTNTPGRAGEDCHWTAPVWPVDRVEVREGDELSLSVRRRGNRFSVEVEKVG